MNSQYMSPLELMRMQAAERKLNATAYTMDDAVREAVHAELAPCSPQEFLERYIELHLEMTGEPWMYANWPLTAGES